MSFEHPWRWSCDTCPRVVEVRDRGLPRGWTWVSAGEKHGVDQTTHCCVTCTAAEIELAKAEKRAPVVHRPRDSYATDEPIEVVSPDPPTGQSAGRVPPCRSTAAGR